MKKTTLIAGKDYPAGTAYSTFAVEAERNVLITLPYGVDSDISPLNTETMAWNRPSPISARGAVLKAINAYKSLDEVILVFDAQFFAPDYTSGDIEGISHSVDDLILGYSYMAHEAITHFEKQGSGRLVFILKYAPTSANPVRSGPDVRPASIPLAVAQDAYIALAENYAARFENDKPYQITLVRADTNSDSEICTWLFSYLNDLQNRKTSGWLKVGTKTGRVFSFLK
ncbi:MAG: hypothetical protein J5505_07345 [Spirochaetaceae bacterium]|nr:hypothetical protein [Spirochaetaceae bacterium]